MITDLFPCAKPGRSCNQQYQPVHYFNRGVFEASIQFGVLHPAEGPDAFPNLMGFSAEKLVGTKALVPPDITFKDGVVEMHMIAGLRVEVLPCKTDVADSVAY